MEEGIDELCDPESMRESGTHGKVVSAEAHVAQQRKQD